MDGGFTSLVVFIEISVGFHCHIQACLLHCRLLGVDGFSTDLFVYTLGLFLER